MMSSRTLTDRYKTPTQRQHLSFSRVSSAQRTTFTDATHIIGKRNQETQQREKTKMATETKSKPKMATANTPSLDCRVASYVKNWETDIRNKLKSTKVMLLSSTPRQRPKLKTKVETLCAVLDLLQGRRIRQEADTCSTTELWGEITALKLKLNASESKEKQTADSLRAQMKINRELKRQLEQVQVKQLQTAQAAERTAQDLRCQLKEVQVKSASRLSLETAINMNLSSKLEEVHQQMQRHQSQRSTASPADLSEFLSQEKDEMQEDKDSVLCSTGSEPTCKQIPSAPAAETVSMEGQGSDASVSELQLETPEEEVPGDIKAKDVGLTEKEEKKVVCLMISTFQEIMDNAVSELWNDQQATLKSQRVEIEKLHTALKLAKEQLEVQRKESAQVLQEKEQELAEKSEELENRSKEVNSRRPRRRNWFARMFACGSGRGVEE